MVTISDDTALIVRGVLRLSRRLRSERPQSSVSLSAAGMLSTLHRMGPMPAARLAKAERLQPQSLSRLIAQMERDGLIKRRGDERDRRSLILEITAAGRQALSRDMTARREWLEGAMRRVLQPGERAMLAHAAVAMLRLGGRGGGGGGRCSGWRTRVRERRAERPPSRIKNLFFGSRNGLFRLRRLLGFDRLQQ